MTNIKFYHISILILFVFLQTQISFAENQGSEVQQWKKLPTLRKTSGTEEEMKKEFLVLEIQKECREAVDKATRDYSHSPELIDEAIKKLDKLASEYPDLDAGIRALFWKADLLMLHRDYAGAADVFGEVAEQYNDYPESIDARIHWSEQLFVMKKPEEAVIVLEAVKDVGKDKPIPSPYPLRYELLIHLSESYFRSGREDQGKQILAEAAQEFPKKAEEIQIWYDRCIVPLSNEGALVVWTKDLLKGPLALSGVEENSKSVVQVASDNKDNISSPASVKESNIVSLKQENEEKIEAEVSGVQSAIKQVTTTRPILGNMQLTLVIVAFWSGIFCLLAYFIWKKGKTSS